MVRHCCFCTLYGKKPLGSLFVFSDKKNVFLKEWINFIGPEQYSDTVKLYLCEKHFDPNQIIQGKRKYLMKNAIPKDSCMTETEDSDENDFLNYEDQFKTLDKICNPYVLPQGNAKHSKINWDELCSISKIFIERYDNFDVKRFNNFFIISMQNSQPPFDNLFTIQVNESKNVRFYCKSAELNRQIFKDFFSKPYIADEATIKDLISEINSNIKYYLDNTVQNLNKDELIVIIRKEFENESLIKFFMKQLTLSEINKINSRYITETLEFT